MRNPGAIFAIDDNGNNTTEIGWWRPATDKDAADMIATPADDSGDTRSEWGWLRLQNGDLMFGCFPQGGTYENFSEAGVCDYGDASVTAEPEWEVRATVAIKVRAATQRDAEAILECRLDDDDNIVRYADVDAELATDA